MLTCTFAGHTEVYAADIGEKLANIIEHLLTNEDDATFYVGGRGEFDSLAAATVRAAKVCHRDKKIQLYLVEPYMSKQINRDKDFYSQLYDGIIVPQELMGVHPKSAITKRNRVMVDWSNVLIAFVYRDFGGAYETLKYAKQKGDIRIINLAEEATL